jgi:hypothetical protein
MNLYQIIITCLVLNAVMHVVSFYYLNKQQDNSRWGVLAFVLINMIIALLLQMNFSWAIYLAIVFPAIGGIGLTATLKSSKAPLWVDLSILALDLTLIICSLYFLFV